MPKTNGTYGTSWLWIKTCPRFHITRTKAGCSSPQTEKSPTPGNLKSFISIPFAAALPVSSSNFSVITVAIAPWIVHSWGDLAWTKPAMNGSCPIQTGTAPMAIKTIKTITWDIQLGGCIALSRWVPAEIAQLYMVHIGFAIHIHSWDLRIHWGSTQCWPNHHPLAMYLHDQSGSISKIIFDACVCKYVCMYVRTYACMCIYVCVIKL